jgi:hypothetical protein
VANSIENIEKALNRIDAWTKKICRATASVAARQAVRLPYNSPYLAAHEDEYALLELTRKHSRDAELDVRKLNLLVR